MLGIPFRPWAQIRRGERGGKTTVKQFLLVAMLACSLSACMVATSSNVADQGSGPPRDQPFGKGNAGNDTLHQPSGGALAANSSGQSIPPRDPPFGKGDQSNDTLHQPSSGTLTASPSDPIPPRDQPFGKGT